MSLLVFGPLEIPLGYSTNVHPGRDLDEARRSLENHAARVRERVAPDRQLGVGLWLSARTVRELSGSPEAVADFGRHLARAGLVAFTLNAFPFGDFHAERVKEEVYRPSWADPRRREHTERAAAVLAALLPEGLGGSISTVGGGGRADGDDPATRHRMGAELRRLDAALADLERRTGRRIELALEPEPLTTFERTPEIVDFFAEHLGGCDHLGVCLDVCHQAVVFEDVAASLTALRDGGVRVAKIQLSNALEVVRPGTNGAGREALAAFAEDRYFHQIYARFSDGRVDGRADLPDAVPAAPPGWLEAEAWRVHFHVPVFARDLGALSTTRPSLEAAIDWIQRERYETHLEIETYTWGVLPPAERARLGADLAEGIAAEFEWVLARGIMGAGTEDTR